MTAHDPAVRAAEMICDLIRAELFDGADIPIVPLRITAIIRDAYAPQWQPISSAPKDGTWFLVCNAADGWDSYEVGYFKSSQETRFVEQENGLYRKVTTIEDDWVFNNMHRATHWQPLPAPPSQQEKPHE